MGDKKILYISIVDWDWIKQRPQIIAEELALNYDVLYLCPKYYNRKLLAKNRNDSKKLKLLYRVKIPYTSRFTFLKKIDIIFSHIMIDKIIKKELPDVIYISHPDDYSRKFELKKSFIIYDCMDNYSEFESGTRKNSIIANEKVLCEISDCILVTSQFLLNKIKQYKVNEQKIHLIRNGYSGNVINEIVNSNFEKKNDIVKFFYIGTVGTWFDFELLERTLEYKKNVEFHIAGPLGRKLPQNKSIIYDGVIPHEQLNEYVKDCDIFIMPFKINKIVEAVDPVKLYEYINFNKPIISVYYSEVDRFSEFVYFYNDIKTFLIAIDEALNKGSKYNNKKRIEFLKENSWSNRGKQIDEIIDLALTMGIDGKN